MGERWVSLLYILIKIANYISHYLDPHALIKPIRVSNVDASKTDLNIVKARQLRNRFSKDIHTKLSRVKKSKATKIHKPYQKVEYDSPRSP